ncbi:MAG: glycosyltransferase [Lachnospiraceae bacterium]|nr:glycosyltransferase [Lachnospiraceae bacterium]
MENLVFTIVMPSYGVEAYIRDAIEDVLHQSYRRWELIIVDDASPDRTGTIAEEYAANDTRIRVIHQQDNKGVSAARNMGLSEARGEYILFLDPDDRYDSELLMAIYQKLMDEKVDVVIYGHTEDYLDETGQCEYSREFFLPTQYVNDKGVIRHLVVELEEMTMYGYPWNKAFSVSHLRERGVVFPDIAHIEDILFNVDAFKHVHSMQLISDRLYHYINRVDDKSRATRKVLTDYFELQKIRINAIRDQQERWGTVDTRMYTVLASEYFRSMFSMMERGIREGQPAATIIATAEAERSTEMFGVLSRYLGEGSRTVRFLYAPLARGNFRQAYRRAYFVSWVRENFPFVFAKLK